MYRSSRLTYYLSRLYSKLSTGSNYWMTSTSALTHRGFFWTSYTIWISREWASRLSLKIRILIKTTSKNYWRELNSNCQSIGNLLLISFSIRWAVTRRKYLKLLLLGLWCKHKPINLRLLVAPKKLRVNYWVLLPQLWPDSVKKLWEKTSTLLKLSHKPRRPIWSH
jgi:hypothetical protein